MVVTNINRVFKKIDKGVLYILFSNDELVKAEDCPVIYKSRSGWGTYRASKKGNRFVTKLYRCRKCGKGISGKLLKEPVCPKCYKAPGVSVKKHCVNCVDLRTTNCKDVSDCIQHGYKNFKKRVDRVIKF